MFEIFMLTTMLAIGLSHLLPEVPPRKPKWKRITSCCNRNKPQKRTDRGGLIDTMARSGGRQKSRNQTPAVRTSLNTSAATALPNK